LTPTFCCLVSRWDSGEAMTVLTLVFPPFWGVWVYCTGSILHPLRFVVWEDLPTRSVQPPLSPLNFVYPCMRCPGASAHSPIPDAVGSSTLPLHFGLPATFSGIRTRTFLLKAARLNHPPIDKAPGILGQTNQK